MQMHQEEVSEPFMEQSGGIIPEVDSVQSYEWVIALTPSNTL